MIINSLRIITIVLSQENYIVKCLRIANDVINIGIPVEGLETKTTL
jgi:hypothetical protein